jgi:HK97 family phage prohead protease
MLDVDSQARTVVGLAVPYGPAARLRSRRRRFVAGWCEVDPVPVLLNHVRSARVGTTIGLAHTAGGLLAALRIRPGVAGDRILSRADQGLYGLSVGFDIGDEIVDEEDPMVRVVRRGLLAEISLTATPAFGGAR